MNIIRTLHYTIIALPLLIFCSNTEAAQSRAKPLPPVRVMLSPVQPGLESSSIKPGDVVEFKVSILSSVDASEMRVHSSLDGGAELVTGELTWTGQARRAEETSVLFTVRAPLKGKGKISTRVEIYSGDVLLYSTKAMYEIGITVKDKPDKPRGVRKDSKGQGVVEYR